MSYFIVTVKCRKLIFPAAISKQMSRAIYIPYVPVCGMWHVVICVELPVNANPTRRCITNAMFVSGKLKRRANREVLGMEYT